MSDRVVILLREAGWSGKALTLAAWLSWHESRWNTKAVGDGGLSYGAFQIHTPSHPDEAAASKAAAELTAERAFLVQARLALQVARKERKWRTWFLAWSTWPQAVRDARSGIPLPRRSIK